jgi:hypothetical protein
MSMVPRNLDKRKTAPGCGAHIARWLGVSCSWTGRSGARGGVRGAPRAAEAVADGGSDPQLGRAGGRSRETCRALPGAGVPRLGLEPSSSAVARLSSVPAPTLAPVPRLGRPVLAGRAPSPAAFAPPRPRLAAAAPRLAARPTAAGIGRHRGHLWSRGQVERMSRTPHARPRTPPSGAATHALPPRQPRPAPRRRARPGPRR